MKRTRYKTLLLFCFSALIISGCTQLTDRKLQGQWKSVEYNVNGVNQLETSVIFLELKADGGFSQRIFTGELEREELGLWALETSPHKLKLLYTRSGQTVNWKIIEGDKNFLHLTNEETRGFFVELKLERQH